MPSTEFQSDSILLLNLPFKMVSTANSLNEVENDPYINDTLEAGSMSGFGNLGIAGKFLLVEKNYVLSAQLAVQNKMHQYQPNSGLRIGYKAWIITPSILYGKGWNKSWFQAEVRCHAEYRQLLQQHGWKPGIRL